MTNRSPSPITMPKMLFHVNGPNSIYEATFVVLIGMGTYLLGKEKRLRYASILMHAFISISAY